MPTVVTLTLNPTIDKSTAVDTVASEIKLRCDSPTFDPGGGGINVSRAMHKLGAESIALYTAGGSGGAILGELLDAEGLRHQAIPIQDYTRENLTVFEKSTTLQYRFGMPGPTLTTAEWQKIIDVTLSHDADYIVASGSLPPGVPDDFYAQLARRMQGGNAQLVVDTSGKALEAMVNTNFLLAKPNLAEVETLSGQKFENEDQLKEMTQTMIKAGHVQNVVVSLGAGGAAFISADDFRVMRPPVVPIRSKVGAGDSMVGGIMTALVQGRDLADAVKYGIAAGTAAVMTDGTQLCRKEDVEWIYKKIATI